MRSMQLPESTSIPANSRQEAMDWSLVLISQGIESRIHYLEESSTWMVEVAVADHERALASINQYRKENRGWPWQRQVSRSGLRFDWGCVGWLFLIIMFYWLDQHSNLTAGLLDTRAVTEGQCWRLFTALWLHADLGHLATNAALGLLLSGLVMGRFGTGLGLLSICLTGIGGNLASWLLASTPHISLGASGMVMGCVGLLTAQRPSQFWTSPPPYRKLVTSLCGGIMLFVLLGLEPKSDVVAHGGGFLSGLMIGWILCLAPTRWRKPSSDLAAGIVFVLLVTLPWLIALRDR
jgi:membrane associated rhomboid family serine protease